MSVEVITLFVGLFSIAVLYSSVGHAGASGYIAVMSLLGMVPGEIKTTALLLNILVASITTIQFYRAGHFRWNLFWPFALLSVPFAFLGGYIPLPTHWFKVIVGVILLFSASRFIFTSPIEKIDQKAPAAPVALGVGAGLGLLSGLTGTGGGIFLTPILILMGWASARVAAGVSAPFILVNSMAGLVGNIASTNHLPTAAWPLAIVVMTGGFAGSYIGSRKLHHNAIKHLLAVVLAIAGVKFLLT